MPSPREGSEREMRASSGRRAYYKRKQKESQSQVSGTAQKAGIPDLLIKRQENEFLECERSGVLELVLEGLCGGRRVCLRGTQGCGLELSRRVRVDWRLIMCARPGSTCY